MVDSKNQKLGIILGKKSGSKILGQTSFKDPPSLKFHNRSDFKLCIHNREGN
jgi:hypothetical protein